MAGGKYLNRVEQKLSAQINKPEQSYDLNPMDEIFKGELLEKAGEFEEKENQDVSNSSSSTEKIAKKKKSNKKIQQKIKGKEVGNSGTIKVTKPTKNKLGLKIKKKSIVNKKVKK